MATKRKPPPSRTRRTGMRWLRQGLLGGSRWRLGLGLALFGLSVVRRAIKRDEVIVYKEELRAGEKLVIRHLPPEDQRV